MVERTPTQPAAASGERATANDVFLEFDLASKGFDGLTVFDGLSIRLERGVAYGLVGPNACGKTTLLHSAMGLTRLDRGAVRYRGTDVTRLKPHSIARLGLGIVLQNVGIFHRISVLENVLTAGEALRRWSHAAPGPSADGVPVGGVERAQWALEQVKLIGDEHRMAGSLVPGTQKRVAVARALYAARDLLLDEPVSGVGSETRALLQRLIRAMVSRGQSVLIVEHDIDFVLETCDKVMLLQNGGIACKGPPSDVQKDDAFTEFYSSLRIEEAVGA